MKEKIIIGAAAAILGASGALYVDALVTAAPKHAADVVQVRPCDLPLSEVKPYLIKLRGNVGEAQVRWDDKGGAHYETVNCDASGEGGVWEKCAPIWRKEFCK